MNTLSVELLSRAGYPGFYAELTQQLQNAYLTAIDTAALTALLAAGTNATKKQQTAKVLLIIQLRLHL
jgi:hypothetical protein